MGNIVLFGLPGAGKGTQANNLKNEFNLFKVSTGDLLREEIKKESALGKKIKSIIDQGHLVDDDIINNLIEEKIESPVSAEDGIMTSKIIHSLYASYEQKSWIRIKDNIKSQKLGL